MELSIIIPAYDEARKIARDVEAAGAFLYAQGIDGEIIVADDGSTDGTGDVALRTKVPPGIALSVITLKHHTGKGAAVRAGVARSGGTYVMFADAGLTVPYADALRGLALVKGGRYELAHGSRWLPESIIRKPQDTWRRSLSRMVWWMLRRALTLPNNLTDTQCGFKVYHGDAARALFSRCTTGHFLVDVEVLVLALKQGYRVAEFPVSWNCDRDSRLSVRSHALQVISDLLAIRRLDRRFPTRS